MAGPEDSPPPRDPDLDQGLGLGGGGTSAAAPRLRVPGNLVNVVREISRETGVPFEVIAGVAQTQYATGTAGDWSSKITPEVLADIGVALRDSREGPFTDYRIVARNVFGGRRSTWLDRFDSIVYSQKDGKPDYSAGPKWIEREPTLFNETGPGATRSDLEEALRKGNIDEATYRQRLGEMGYPAGDIELFLRNIASGQGAPAAVDIMDVYTLYNSLLGEYPSEAEAKRYVGLHPDVLRARLLVRPEARAWREQGPKIQATRRWADSIFMRLTGNEPTNAEIMEVAQRNYTPQSLETYLRSRPSGSTTLGVMADTRALADKYATDFVGRDADEGEINWIITHNVQTPEGIEAFYEQLRTRIETNDPNFAWAVDPRTWRTRRDEVQREWNRLGLTGDVSPQFVNRAVNERWDAERVEDEINGLQAPGFAEGVKVGQVNRVRTIATPYKQSVFPGQDVTKEELELLLPMHPEEVRKYYRSLNYATDFTQGVPKGRPDIGAGALRGETYTKPEEVSIEAPALPGGIGG